MTSHLAAKVKPLIVRTISLKRYASVEVTLSAPVTDTESFYFIVPRTSMQMVLKSLEVRDTRGGRPHVSFPSPNIPKVKPLILKKTSAWKDLLMRHQGAHIELHTPSGPVEGYFLGFQDHLRRYDDRGLSIVMLCNGNVCVCKADPISTITFKSAQVKKKVERYTSTLCRTQEQDPVCRINVTASGVGDGDVFASYIVISPFLPTYDFFYTVHAEEDTDKNDINYNKKADGERSEYPKVQLRCYAVIHNPLHYDVRDVHITLCSGNCRYFIGEDAYDFQDELTDERTDKPSSRSSSQSYIPRRHRSRSPVRSRSPSPTPLPQAQSPAPGSPAKSASYNSQSDQEWDSASDTESISTVSTTSLNANRQAPSREWDVPNRICMKEGETVKVFLYETQMEGGLVHHYAGNNICRRAVMLHNTTDVMFEGGWMMFYAKGISLRANMQHLKPGQDQFYVYHTSGCAVKAANSSRRKEPLCSRISDKNLVVKVVRYRKKRYLVHNKEDEQIHVGLDHHSGKRTDGKLQVIARFYRKASAWDEEDEDGGEKLDEYSAGYLGYNSYLIKVEAKQRCVVVVSETEEKIETHNIFEYSKQEIAKLEEKRMIGTALAGKLGQLVDMKRDLERLKRLKELFRKRLEGITRYERELAKAKISDEAKAREEGVEEFLKAIEAAGDSVRRIDSALDKVESDAMKVVGQMKALKEEICNVKEVELVNKK